MSEYPDYFPPFMRDFHDQKDLVKAFYTYLDMRDNKREAEGKENDPYHSIDFKRRSAMCAWTSFHILLASFIDFLHLNGYQIYKARAKGVGKPEEFGAIVNDLKELPDVWYSLTNPGGTLAYNTKHCIKIMDRWTNWFPYMPPEAVEAYRKAKEATNGDNV